MNLLFAYYFLISTKVFKRGFGRFMFVKIQQSPVFAMSAVVFSFRSYGFPLLIIVTNVASTAPFKFFFKVQDSIRSPQLLFFEILLEFLCLYPYLFLL